ncbi:MAG: hypothetical protein D6732_03565 [Methanobacteriota archaeon]|nr:MAG: hypothetical protein D6732_03565 [Euryarchaeota archaeon]
MSNKAIIKFLNNKADFTFIERCSYFNHFPNPFGDFEINERLRNYTHSIESWVSHHGYLRNRTVHFAIEN